MENETQYFGKITTNKEYISFSYNDSRFFSSLEFKCLEAVNVEGLAPCIKITINGKPVVMYSIAGKVPLQSLVRAFHSKELAYVLYELFYVIYRVVENDILDVGHLFLDEHNIFLDKKDYSVAVILCPLSEKQIGQDQILDFFYGQCLQWIASVHKNDWTMDKEAIFWLETLQKIEEKMREKESYEDIYEFLKTIHDDEIKRKSPSAKLILEPLDSNGSVPLIIDKDDYLIGRKRGVVDGFVGDNKLDVGRKHCKIIQDKNAFYVVDLHSRNGTYLDDVILQSDVPYALANGGILRLGELLEYKVIIQQC